MDPEALLVPMRTTGSPALAGAHCSDGFDVETPWHHHDMHQLLYAFDGAVEVEGLRGLYKIPHQFAVWIPAGAVHRTKLQRVASGSVFLNRDAVVSTATSPRVIFAPPILREMLMYAMRWPLGRTPDRVSRSFFDCFANLCPDWLSHEVHLVLPTSSDPRIRSVMDYTVAKLATVTFDDVCRSVNMSERTLRRRFRAAAGLGWAEYRLRARMCVAIEQLEATDRQIGVIATHVGYDNQAAFARAFRKFAGIGPSEYRRKQVGYYHRP